jgi:hypothetical protein
LIRSPSFSRRHGSPVSCSWRPGMPCTNRWRVRSSRSGPRCPRARRWSEALRGRQTRARRSPAPARRGHFPASSLFSRVPAAVLAMVRAQRASSGDTILISPGRVLEISMMSPELRGDQNKLDTGGAPRNSLRVRSGGGATTCANRISGASRSSRLMLVPSGTIDPRGITHCQDECAHGATF